MRENAHEVPTCLGMTKLWVTYLFYISLLDKSSITPSQTALLAPPPSEYKSLTANQKH